MARPRPPLKKEPKTPTMAGQHVPEFMKGHEGKGLEQIGPGDIDWVGKDMELSDGDAEQIYETLFTPEAALTEILWSILRTQRDRQNETPHKRLQSAVAIILPGKPLNGRPPASDDMALLAKVASLYLVNLFETSPSKRSTTAICRSVLTTERTDFVRMAPEGQNSIVKRLRDKFTKDLNRHMVAATNEGRRDSRNYRSHIKQVIDSLTALGLING